MWFYFDELEHTFALGTINVFKVAAVFSHVATQQQIWRNLWILWHQKPLQWESGKNSCVFMHLFEIVLASHTVNWPLHSVLNCCQIKNKLDDNTTNNAYYVFYTRLQIPAIPLWNLFHKTSYLQKCSRWVNLTHTWTYEG